MTAGTLRGMSQGIRTVCPHARVVDSDPAGPKVVCGPMERDQVRADRILEGSPTGIVVSAREDPSTFFGFCCGEGPPRLSPDGPLSAHYSCCPVYAADLEWERAQRLFGEMKREPEKVDAPGLSTGPEKLTVAERAWLAGARS